MSAPDKDKNGIRHYGEWAGNPKGHKENPENCIEEIWPTGRWGATCRYQCNRKRGYGPDGLYCKQHAKKHEKQEQSK